MSKAVKANPITETKSSESNPDFYTMVTEYRPLICNLTENSTDAKDLEQEVYVRYLNRSKIQPDWWDQIEKKEAYLVRMIRNKALDLKRRQSPICISCDDSESKASIDKLSDDGRWANNLNEEMDLEEKRLLLKEIVEDFSEHDRKLLQLNFVEGLKPREIAEKLKMNYADVQVGCNRVKSALRGKLKKIILSSQ